MGWLQERRERQRLAGELAAKALGTQPYFAGGRHGEMVPPLRAWLDQALAGLGPEHDVTLELRCRLAAALRATGAVAEAGEQAAAVVAQRERLGMSQILVQAWVLSADTLDGQGRHDEAAAAWGALGEHAAKDLDRRDVVRIARAQRVGALCHAERYGEAEQEALRLLESAGTTSGPAGAGQRLAALILLSAALRGQGRAVEAESAARQGLVIASTDGGPRSSANVYVLHVNLAAAVEAQGRHAEALDLLAVAPRPPQLTVETSVATALAQARALLALGRPQEAAAVIDPALATGQASLGPDHARLRELRTLRTRAAG